MKNLTILILTLAAIGHGISALDQTDVERAALQTVGVERCEINVDCK